MNKITIIIFILTASVLTSNAQITDSTRTKRFIKKNIFPTLLIGAGVMLNNSQFEQDFQVDLRNEIGNDFELSIDDYFQYVPIVEMYLFDIFKVKAQHHWFDQTKYLFISNLITATLTHSIKRLSLKTRPDGSRHSFPSGHTTLAFTNAAVLKNEFYQTNSILSFTGYLFASTTGTFRILNNKHWISDVLLGAGIAIVVTNIVYYFEPFKNINPFIKIKNVSLLPQISENQVGVYFSLKL